MASQFPVLLLRSNEDKDDLATADAKYLLIPFLLAELLVRSTVVDQGERQELLVQASNTYLRCANLQLGKRLQLLFPGSSISGLCRLNHSSRAVPPLCRFLRSCEQYGVLGSESQAALEQVDSGEASDPTSKRDAKVARFKRFA